MTDHAQYIIAVDGGGSTCRVAIATAAGRVIASETGPSANVSTSLEDGTATIRETVHTAWAHAKLPAEDLPNATAYLGLAGVKSPRIADAVAQAFPTTHVTVAEDRTTTMAGALGDHDGFVAAIGTGSFLGRQDGAKQRFVGGWGMLLGDQASGAWLGRELLARVLEWQDGLREASGLLERTLSAFDGEPSAIVAFAAKAQPRDIAGHAPSLLDAADAGDAVAVEIMRDGAAYLRHALDSLEYRGGDRLCLMGGIGARYGSYIEPLYTEHLAAPLGSALDGALRLAMASHASRRDL